MYANCGRVNIARYVFDRVFDKNIVVCNAIIRCYGMVEEAQELFARMGDYAVKQNEKHYACMVDTLGRAGYLDRAVALIKTMPAKPEKCLWCLNWCL
ncbi:hypothetical protein GH714_034762 [Hevea brasiliensis]|uniref:Pentacotripeptide-repeat region of PRORP domain-containing protein n=1 Tax=Hevea brasiliensis TaxID=3981 RepID=A0A6A6MJC8_HEVBR|nr:hypothetical protein GH714_034762 [Hevea brasiliensis]